MSQEPNIPVERQAKQHRPAIIGIAVALLASVIAFFVFSSMDGETAEEPASEIVTPEVN